MALTKRGGFMPGGGRPKSPEEKIVIAASVSSAVVDALKTYSKERRLSKSWVVEEALRKFLGFEQGG
jgi:hypothetical protein